MGYRGRLYFTEKQKAEIWDRWQRGESMSSIGRMFDRNSVSEITLNTVVRGVFHGAVSIFVHSLILRRGARRTPRLPVRVKLAVVNIQIGDQRTSGRFRRGLSPMSHKAGDWKGGSSRRLYPETRPQT